MPTIDDLRESLEAREVHAPDPEAVLRHFRDRRRPHRRLAAPLVAAAAVLTVGAVAAVLPIANHHAGNPPGDSRDRSAANTEPPPSPLVPSEVAGDAVDPHTHTVALTGYLTNSSNADLAINYPIALVSDNGAPITNVDVRLIDSPVYNYISTDGIPPARVSQISAGAQVKVWIRMTVDCSQTAGQPQAQANLSIVVPIQGQPSERIHLSDFSTNPGPGERSHLSDYSASPGQGTAADLLASLQHYACRG